MSALAPVLAVSVLSMCLSHALLGVAAENLPRSDCGTKPADIVFLLDSSASVGVDNFEKVKDFLKQFVNSVTIGPTGFNVGVVTFGINVNNVFSLNAHTTKSSLLAAIDNIPYNYGGYTRTDLGLQTVRQESFTTANGDRDDANNILVVITDGQSTYPPETIKEAKKIHKTDIKVVAIGVGKANQQELETIAGDDGNVFDVTNFDALTSIEEGLKITACEAAVAPIVDCGTKPADIVFLLDSSHSVSDSEFDQVKEFLKQFVKSVKIGPMDFNVGVVTFDSDVRNIFWLNTYTTKSSLLAAIDSFPRTGGVTNTDRGLEFVRQEAFTRAHGDREDANNILVVVTDGMSFNKTLTDRQANMLHKTDIKVVAVGVGVADQQELETIASDDNSVFEVTNFDALKSIEEGVKITACEAAAAPVNRCRAPSGDIVFMLDSSGSLGPGHFEEVKDFVKNMAKSFNIGPDEVNIGVFTFDTVVHEEFPLKAYTSKSSLIDAIDRIPYHQGITNTHLALSYARLDAFSQAQGDRDYAANILIVITDGQSEFPDKTEKEAKKLYKSGVSVLVIGIGDNVDEADLEIIANGQENVFDVTDFSALDTVKNKLAKTACEAITTGPYRRALAATRPYVFRGKEE